MQAAGRLLAVVAFAGLCSLTACSATRPSASASAAANATSDTVGGVGRLPGPLTSLSPESGLAVDSVPVIPVVDAPPVGTTAAGNRLLIIGDSVMASISQRYGGEACARLVPLGWKVEVDAETGRFIDFGQQVLSSRLSAGWDAAVVFLGNNYDGNADYYRSQLHKLLEKLAPRPVALLTTMLFRDVQSEVNDIIRSEAQQFDNVSVIDWASVTDPTLTGRDRLHLTESGRAVLADALALSLGEAPQSSESASTEPSATEPPSTDRVPTTGDESDATVGAGECLKTSFSDDSAGSPDGPAGNITKPAKTPSSPSSNTTSSNTTAATTPKTTVPAGTTQPRSTVPPTTVKPGTTGTTTPQVTSPPQTSPPQTQPPQTQPPQTSPPQTSPPQTQPPTTGG